MLCRLWRHRWKPRSFDSRDNRYSVDVCTRCGELSRTGKGLLDKLEKEEGNRDIRCKLFGHEWGYVTLHHPDDFDMSFGFLVYRRCEKGSSEEQALFMKQLAQRWLSREPQDSSD